MIDPAMIRQIEEENPDLAIVIRSSILSIANSGILERQLAAAFESVLAGALDEAPDQLAIRIHQYRLENHGLIALQALAEQIRKES